MPRAVVYDTTVSEGKPKLRNIHLLYPRRVTTGAVATVAVLSTLWVRALLPRAARPTGWPPVLVASIGAYLALRVGSYTGLSKHFKHTYLDWFSGDVDDAQTWMLAAVGGGSVLVVLGQLRRLIGAPR
jgi:hypothetical protein